MTETAQGTTATDGAGAPGAPDGGSSLMDALPTDKLLEAGRTLLTAVAERAVEMALERVDGLTDRLTDVADNGGVGLSSAIGGGMAAARGENPVGGVLKSGASALKDKVTGALGMGGDSDDDSDSDSESGGGNGAGGGGGRGKFKFMNITEQMDVGVPIRTVYDQWTQFADFPSFMKKLESVDQTTDEKSTWKAQVFLSHRSWETTIREQVPDSHIIWVSSGAKGHADGCISFHELAPNMTRILLVMEYYPQGFFEKTGNLWRAVGRRTRLEFKHFCRHVTMDTLLHRDDLEGWRGEIRDSEVVKTHEEAMQEEQEAAGEGVEPYDRDEDGTPIDEDGNPIDEDELVDEDGEPVDGDEPAELLDEDGEPVDEDEAAELLDEDEDEYEDLDGDLEADEAETEDEDGRARPSRRQRTPA